ncbi:MAG: InlB B-repeat-containing protein, partial [Chloroflexi bacterium]|nr:InlB B-repeat-containing protein [Chloroflexota bacterium]
TAQWLINEYTITFDSKGGSLVSDITQDFNTPITAPDDPTREGYTFAGWLPVVPTTIPAENKIVTAQWLINEYTITFDSKGGSLVSDITQYFNTGITAPDDPTREGYTFDGWLPIVPTSMPAENMSVTAQWLINEYTITFDSNGGTLVSDITQDFNTSITARDDPTREGYTFDGWLPVVPTTMPAENTTVTAQWLINEYTITFDSNGGSAVADITAEFGKPITAPDDPTREGYTFDGWHPIVPTSMPAENRTVTAQWLINEYTITFDSDGGSAVSDITQDFDTGITAPDNPTREGYTFDGWLPIVPTTMPADDMIIAAQWIINEYKVTFLNWDNTPLAIQTVPYGGIATPPAYPTREGYTFIGWNQDYDNIKDDLVANALFTENTPVTGENALYLIAGIVLLLVAAGLSIVLLRNKFKINKRK